MRERVLFAVVFTLPIAAMIAFDVKVLGRVYALEYNDAAAGGYGAGLDWLTFHAWPTPHHPAYLFHQATALLVAAAGVYPQDLNGFQTGVLTVNLLFAFACGFWAAGPARRLGLNLVDAGILGVLIVTMPSVMVFASQWTPYSLLGPSIVALAIVLFELWHSDENPRARWWFGGIGLGLIAGSYFPALAIAAAVIPAVFVRIGLSSDAWTNRWLGFGGGNPSRGLRLATYVAICAVGASVGTLEVCFRVFPQMRIYDYHWHQLALSFLIAMVVAAIPTFVILRCERRLGRWGRLIPGVGGPVLIGWLIASNVMAPFWRYAAEGALRGRSGAVAWESAKLYFVRFFEHYWNVLIILALVALTAYALLALRRRDWSNALLTLTAILTGVLSLGAALRTLVETTPIAIDPGMFGQAPRVFICILLTLAVAYLYLRREQCRVISLVAMSVVFTLGAASAWQHVTILGPATAKVRNTVDRINALTASHLRVGDQARLLCVRSRIPEECAMAYAFDHARYPRGRALLPPPLIKNGAVCYLRQPPSDCTEAERMWREAGCTPLGGPMLISEELLPSQGTPKNTEMQGYFFGLRMNISRCPARE